MTKPLLWILFFASTIVAASSSAVWTINGDWYQALEKPFFTPPSWLFGPVWTTLYILIATVGFRLVRTEHSSMQNFAVAVWALQMCLNTIWTPVFFGAYALGVAFAYIAALWVTILILIVICWRVDRLSAWLMMPYLAWVSLASALNFAVWQMNPAA